MVFAKYIESMKTWMTNPQDKVNKFEKFKDKFAGVPVEDRETLIGKPIIVEVKKAFRDALYGDIKKMPKKG